MRERKREKHRREKIEGGRGIGKLRGTRPGSTLYVWTSHDDCLKQMSSADDEDSIEDTK
jgi:hypothetical protein